MDLLDSKVGNGWNHIVLGNSERHLQLDNSYLLQLPLAAFLLLAAVSGIYFAVVLSDKNLELLTLVYYCILSTSSLQLDGDEFSCG